MKARNTALPASRVVLDTIGGKTTATLWDGTFTEHEAPADPESESQSAAVEYEYTLYQIAVQMRPGLAEAIETHFDDWYAAAAEREAAERNAANAKEMEREISSHLVDTLLDMDFRLMMVEELGSLL